MQPCRQSKFFFYKYVCFDVIFSWHNHVFVCHVDLQSMKRYLIVATTTLVILRKRDDLSQERKPVSQIVCPPWFFYLQDSILKYAANLEYQSTPRNAFNP